MDEFGDMARRRRSVDVRLREEEKEWVRPARVRVGRRKEKEMVKSLRPVVWLTEDFPLKLEELMPLLDILANKVKAVRRLRELLTTKFPPGTFPVKVAIPIVPTVRVVVTFTKFAYLQQPEQFFTPLSSPRLLPVPEEESQKAETHKSSWLRWNTSAAKTSINRTKSVSTSQVVDHVDPFDIPSDYTWVSIHSKSQRTKTSKPKKGKQKETA
ncbi:ankyrin repeat domain-containing protein 13C [Canna indica]|uniref:Ankyrin repeat domain-containing protein 13C n=1 Tax=Canna indica TaxID=4628 RepID=A0AAQ3QIE0_9LILI|nr:ankyrin repeat domain-containing protein 13C [Canna indica]